MDRPVPFNDAVCFGEVAPEIADTKVSFAVGQNKEDKRFKNFEWTVEELITNLSTAFPGPKDGPCLLQGSLVGGGGERQAVNMTANYLNIYDVDNGFPFEEIDRIIREKNLLAMVWETSSNGTTTSEVLEKTLQAFLNKKREPMGFEDEEIKAHCIAYFLIEKNYVPSIFENVEVTIKRVHETGGVRFIITHNPIPKHRVMLFRKTPYSFSSGGTQAQRIAGWRETYKADGEFLGLPFDVSGSDPSRLMYTPRHIQGKDKPKIYIYAGDLFEGPDLSVAQAFTNNPALGGSLRPGSANGSPKRSPTPILTPGLMAFVKIATDLDAVGLWMAHEPDLGPAAQGKGRTFPCPNRDAHSHITDDDKAFWVVPSVMGEGSWYAGCLHATCKGLSNDDRVFYLDRLCQNHGLTVDDLKPYSQLAQETTTAVLETEKSWEGRQKLVNTAGALDKLILAAADDSDVAEIVKHLVFVDPITQDRHITTLNSRHGIKKAVLKGQLKQAEKDHKLFKRAFASSQNNGTNTTFPDPPDDLSNVEEIWSHWEYDVKREALANRMVAMNTAKPTIFKDIVGDRIILQQGWEQKTRKKLTHATWMSVVGSWAKYKSGNPRTGQINGIRLDPGLVNDVVEMPDLPYPNLRRFVAVPIFGPDGKLRLQDGYDAATECYIELPKNTEWYPVSPTPTPEEVEYAIWWLDEALRDFPFTDVFDSADPLPIKHSETDEDGFPLPNMARGMSSRVNAFAMLIQPFVRHLINGPCPIFHIDKASPGTGANFLVDVAYLISDGVRARPTTMSGSEEEFRKNLVAQLLVQPSHLFIDNINKKVDSEHLASAIVSGTWLERILGKSESVNVPVASTIIMAGNNLSFSGELMRRNCPIRMDAATPDPAADRNKNDFKHYPLQPWVLENRTKLVWACHILVANWVAKGMPKDESFVLNSFEDWSRTFTGIFKACGLTKPDGSPLFMANREDYSRERNDEKGQDEGAMEKLFDVFATEKFTTREAFERCINPLTNKLDEVFPVSASTDHGTLVLLGGWLSRQARKTFAFGGRDYTLKKWMSRGNKYYCFIPGGGKTDINPTPIMSDDA